MYIEILGVKVNVVHSENNLYGCKYFIPKTRQSLHERFTLLKAGEMITEKYKILSFQNQYGLYGFKVLNIITNEKEDLGLGEVDINSTYFKNKLRIKAIKEILE